MNLISNAMKNYICRGMTAVSINRGFPSAFSQVSGSKFSVTTFYSVHCLSTLLYYIQENIQSFGVFGASQPWERVLPLNMIRGRVGNRSIRAGSGPGVDTRF